MKNHVQRGENLTLPAPFDCKSGDGVLIGKIFGIAAEDALQDAEVDLVTYGVFTMPKLAGAAIAIGAPVYWHAGTPPAAGKVDGVATGGVRIGVAMIATDSTATSLDVRLDGFVI